MAASAILSYYLVILDHPRSLQGPEVSNTKLMLIELTIQYSKNYSAVYSSVGSEALVLFKIS